jgi:regulation of enolase protein 1 (concanavalin A-like superfamily)
MKRAIIFLLVVAGGISPVFGQAEMHWLNRPAVWSDTNGRVTLTAQGKTDFWRVTRYGYITDNGHFYYREREGDFVATVKVKGDYKDLYDQAGLMIRIDDKNWIKTGIEFVNGRQNISTVFTRNFSDWSVVPKTSAVEFVWFQLVRKADYVEIKYSTDGKNYETVREGYFPPQVKCRIGVMAAAPEGKGFQATFEEFRVDTYKD